MTPATTPPPPPPAGPPSAGRDDLPPLDLLLPAARRIDPDPHEAALADLYAYAPAVRARCTVRVNMVASVDGAAWGPDHRSGSINDDADWRVFRVLRALADVVVVGAGTARAEGYTTLTRPRGLEHLHDAPLDLAVVTRRGDVPAALSDADRPPFVITGTAGARAARTAVPADHVIRVPGTHERDVDLAAGLAALAERGLTQVLAEGGPTLLGDLLRVDLVDELCVTTTPGVVGPGPGRIVAGAAPATTGTADVAPALPRDARLAHLLHSPQDRPGSPAGTTLARWLLPLG